MKPFESFLALKLERYIIYRKSLGYSHITLRSKLRPFDRYVAGTASDLDALQPSFFLRLKQELKGNRQSINDILSSARGFFQYLIRIGDCDENPLQDIPSYTENAYIPFVFSPDQNNQMLYAIQKNLRKTRQHFFYDMTVYIAILLLARCGMRISEPLRLQLKHYHSDDGTIYIEKTKFSKDRLIPVPKPAINEINNYLSVRNRFINNDQNPYILAGQRSKKLPTNAVYKVFYQAVKDIGINQPKRVIADTTFGSPTPHSLRHSFAINTLKQIKDKGKSLQNALPILSAYMGHRKYRYTAVYLKVLDAEHREGLVDFALSRQEEI
jgi:integrase